MSITETVETIPNDLTKEQCQFLWDKYMAWSRLVHSEDIVYDQIISCLHTFPLSLVNINELDTEVSPFAERRKSMICYLAVEVFEIDYRIFMYCCKCPHCPKVYYNLYYSKF